MLQKLYIIQSYLKQTSHMKQEICETNYKKQQHKTMVYMNLLLQIEATEVKL